MPNTGQPKNHRAPDSSMTTRSQSRLSHMTVPPVQELETSHFPTSAEASRVPPADTSATRKPTSTKSPPTTPLQIITAMLEQILAKHNPPRQVKSAIEETLEVTKRAAVEEKDAWKTDTLHAVKSLHNSLKSDLLVVQNRLEAKINELQNDHLKIIASTNNLRSTTEELESKVIKFNDTMDKLTSTTMMYHDAIMAKPTSSNKPSADPKVLDSMDRRAKQVLIGFDSPLENSTMGTCLVALKDKANNIIASLKDPIRPKEVHVVDVARTCDASLLLLFNSKEAADWIKEPDIEDKFIDKFAIGACIKVRKHNILMRWVPITLDPNDRKQHRELEEANGLPEYSIQSI